MHYLELPRLPNILAEWAAIIPLVCHLAGNRQDFKTAGDVALMGRISLGIFPRLGVLAGLSRLLDGGPEFFDQASTKGGATCKVWDVCWGSVFPCANGAASHLVKQIFRSKERVEPERMPEDFPPGMQPDDQATGYNEETSSISNDPFEKPQPQVQKKDRIDAAPPDKEVRHRRYQVLHILKFQYKHQQTVPKTFEFKHWRKVKGYVVCLSLLFLAALLVVCGAYGTSVLILCCAVSNIAEQLVTIVRPPGYLNSNEESTDACMLVAPHSNSQEWTLFLGDRGIVDTLLNKSMITIPATRCNRAVASWFRIAHFVQLLAMTFVAANKGWDGVILLLLTIADFVTRLRFRGAALAKRWATKEHVAGNTSTFFFSSRTMMLGAIEKLGGRRRTVWMDSIISPHPRRDAWLSHLFGKVTEEGGGLSKFDIAWVRRNSALASLSADVLRKTVFKEAV